MLFALAIFAGLLVGWWYATRSEIRRRAQADDRRQRAYLASEARTSGHLWLLAAFFSASFAAGFVREFLISPGNRPLLGALAVIAIAVAARCIWFAIAAYRRSRAAGSAEGSGPRP